MKAYQITDPTLDENYAAIVFAETPGRAKRLGLCTEEFYESEYTNIRAHRIKCMDKYADGTRWRMDWENDKDRTALVKELNWSCVDECWFEDCPAKKWCSRYEDERGADDDSGN